MTAHLCHAEGCAKRVPPKMFACLPHWRMVPGWLQRALWKVYQPGQEGGRAPVTLLYMAVQTRCRIAIAEHEGRDVTALRAELVRYIRARNNSEAMDDDQIIAAFEAVAISKVGR